MKTHALLSAAALCCLLPASLHAQMPRYLDPDVAVPARVSDLIARMTLEEKVSQMMDNAPAITRLNVPEYGWWNEALHGVARAGVATVFPQAIGLAATWDDSLMFRTATVISDEARAKHHQYAREGKRLRYQGLTIFSPNINLFRDPRWGRGQETYGEDPFLTSRMGVAFVRGLQGNDPHYLKTVATVKHFAVHSGPEPLRHEFDAIVSERDLRETYLPHFEAGIREAGAYSLMCAYNAVFGKPACASDILLQNILRNEWGFQGYVVSDCAAINDIYERHKYKPTAAEAAALAVKTGTDLECGLAYGNLIDAVKQGLIKESEIDTALARLFTARFRLGMFDPPTRVPYAQIPYSIVDQPANRALALEVTRKSIVLLKNDNHTLPLRKDLKTIAVIGPDADDWQMLLGNYNGMPTDPVTPLRGIREAVGAKTKVLYARGSDLAEGFATYVQIPHKSLPGGLQVSYFSNRDLAGTPLFTGKDSALNVNYREKSPRADLNPDDFSIRWTGVLEPDHTGEYRLALNGSMKYELYLDDSLVVRSVYAFHDEFGDPRLRAGKPVTLQAGRSYRIRVEAHETYGEAQLQLLWGAPRPESLNEAINAARKADAVVLFLGLSPRLEGEEMDVHIEGFNGGDRTRIDLPAVQQRLLEQVVAVGKPTVLVLLSGSAVAVNWAQQHVPAIVEAWYPGQAAGTAIADVLFGDYNPGGRLPLTFYRSVDDLPRFDDYAMHGRTYRYFEGTPLYPFGHGLSYTTFTYSNLKLSQQSVAADGQITVSATVQNSGPLAGDEVVQLYVQHLNSSVARPREELKGYHRITLQPGQTQTVSFPLSAQQLAYWDSTTHKWTVEGDRVRVLIGASSADIRLSDTLTVIASTIQSDMKTPPTALRLPLLFQNGMVMQRGQPLQFWGAAAPNAEVSIALNGRATRATANDRGDWSGQLPALPAGGPYVLHVESGNDHIAINDVLIGDVWIASGQSNMEWPLAQVNNAAQAIAAAHDNGIREFAVPHAYSYTAQKELPGGQWQHADSAHVGRFSAVAYFFARDLRAATHVPIGIIHTSWGGSNIETWLSQQALGLSDSAMTATFDRERNRQTAVRDTLRKILGTLPSNDEGIVNGDSVWAHADLDDAQWKTMTVPGLWEQAGYPGLDGTAWYRTRFTLTEAEAKAGARVSLGAIDDDDVTWINGVQVGRTNGYNVPRAYNVPASVLKAGENVLAIRVVDYAGGGGLYGQPDQFFVEANGTKHSLAGSWRFHVGAISLQTDGQVINKVPTVLYNQMLRPLQRYPIKGVIWYQGESNANNDAQAIAYKPLFQTLIQSWRKEWNGPHDFPFLWVQLPNFGPYDTIPRVSAGWAHLRESQNAALALPKTGQAVIIDIGGDLHPRDKEPVGARLAKAARKIAYGETNLLASGPTYRTHTMRGNEVSITFDNVGSGLVSHSGANVSGFAVAGADRKWVWANARIVGNRVVVSSPDVATPVAVRYAWGMSPKVGLFNKEGFAAAPFRTDSW